MASNLCQADPSDRPPPHVRAYAWYALLVFILVYVMNFVDRQILAILVGDIKRDLDVSDAQIGFLYGTAFAVFYALFGIPLGRLADSWNRGRLMAIGLVLWSSMTALSGFATSFAFLAAARVGVGVGEASASPAAYSLIADHFPKERRGTAISIYASGLYIGGGLSLPIGAWVVSRWTAAFPNSAEAPLGLAGWQAAFVAVGLPGLALALWVLSLREPRRELSLDRARAGTVWGGFADELMSILPPLTLIIAARLPGELRRNLLAMLITIIAAAGLIWLTGDAAQWSAYGLGVYAVYSWTQSLKHRDPRAYSLIWGSPVFVMLLLVFGGMSFVAYATKFWLPYFAEQSFYTGPLAPSQFLGGMTAKEEVGTILGWSNAISAALGVVSGGYASDVWRQHNPRGRLFVCMASAVAPIPSIALMLTTNNPILFYMLNPVTQLFAAAWVGAAVVSLQELVVPQMRGLAGATYILASTMLGLAVGPYFAGRISVWSGDLAVGIASLYIMAPLAVAGLWFASRRLGGAEAKRERVAALFAQSA